MDQQAAPPIILSSGTKSPLTNAFVQLAPFLDQTNTINGQTITILVLNYPGIRIPTVDKNFSVGF